MELSKVFATPKRKLTGSTEEQKLQQAVAFRCIPAFNCVSVAVHNTLPQHLRIVHETLQTFPQSSGDGCPGVVVTGLSLWRFIIIITDHKLCPVPIFQLRPDSPRDAVHLKHTQIQTSTTILSTDFNLLSSVCKNDIKEKRVYLSSSVQDPLYCASTIKNCTQIQHPLSFLLLQQRSRVNAACIYLLLFKILNYAPSQSRTANLRPFIVHSLAQKEHHQESCMYCFSVQDS